MFASLPYPASDYHICPCCSTEFGNDDTDLSHEQLREMWIANGATWFFGQSPEHWNPWMQLIEAGLLGAYAPPYFAFRFGTHAIIEPARIRNFAPEFEAEACFA
jgi:hypothetical protein